MWWIFNLLGLALAWAYTDLNSADMGQGVVAPIIFGVFLIALLVRLALVSNRARPGSRRGFDDGSSSGGSFFDSGSSCSGDGGDSGGGGCD